jgi:hypothetical protein
MDNKSYQGPTGVGNLISSTYKITGPKKSGNIAHGKGGKYAASGESSNVGIPPRIIRRKRKKKTSKTVSSQPPLKTQKMGHKMTKKRKKDTSKAEASHHMVYNSFKDKGKKKVVSPSSNPLHEPGKNRLPDIF